jgi:hypothetical protein
VYWIGGEELGLVRSVTHLGREITGVVLVVAHERLDGLFARLSALGIKLLE